MSSKLVIIPSNDIPHPSNVKVAIQRLTRDIEILESYGSELKNKEAACLRSVLSFLEQIASKHKSQ